MKLFLRNYYTHTEIIKYLFIKNTFHAFLLAVIPIDKYINNMIRKSIKRTKHKPTPKAKSNSSICILMICIIKIIQ